MAQGIPEPDWSAVNEFIRQRGGMATFQEIAEFWGGGISHQRIQSIQRAGLTKLKRVLHARGLTLEALVVGSIQGQSSAGTASDLGEQ